MDGGSGWGEGRSGAVTGALHCGQCVPWAVIGVAQVVQKVMQAPIWEGMAARPQRMGKRLDSPLHTRHEQREPQLCTGDGNAIKPEG